MIKPVNGHLLIEPLKHESFVASDKGTYEEIGIVVELGELGNENEGPIQAFFLDKGDKVYFDSWLAAKYPKPDAKDKDDFYWLVRFEDIRAIEHED